MDGQFGSRVFGVNVRIGWPWGTGQFAWTLMKTCTWCEDALRDPRFRQGQEVWIDWVLYVWWGLVLCVWI